MDADEPAPAKGRHALNKLPGALWRIHWRAIWLFNHLRPNRCLVSAMDKGQKKANNRHGGAEANHNPEDCNHGARNV